MDRADYVQLYSVPATYQPPEDKDLRDDTRYPNLNSRDYRKRRPDRTLKHNQFFETLDVNEEGLAVLATNDIRGRIWNGNIWGYENLADFSEKSASFKLYCDSPVTKLKFLQEKIFLASQSNGALKVWSTRSEARDADNYCLFMVGGATEHLGLILDMDILFPAKTKAATGSTDCCLKVWDAGAADLQCISTMRFAHSDDITGVSSCPFMDEIFATCSRDKSALIWDYRLPRPAKALYNKHKFAFSTISWCNESEHDGHVLLGDDTGSIYEIDPKVPDKFVTQLKVFNRPIRKISCRSSKTAVIGNTNTVLVYKNLEDSPIYNNEEAHNFVRDVYWDSDNSFYTVAWDKKLRHHFTNSSN